MILHLSIPGLMPQLNDVLRSAKAHFAGYSKDKARQTDLVALLAKSAWRRRPAIAEPVLIRCTWCRKDKRTDPDNTAYAVKYILDGLVAAGVLVNDGPRQIAGIDHRFEYGRENGVEVVISGAYPAGDGA